MSEQIEYSEKHLALAKHLDAEPDELTEHSYDFYGLTVFALGSREYAIGDDAEADEACLAYIKDSAWAFNASFLSSYCDLPESMFKAVQEKCESANDAVLQCIERAEGGLQGFVDEAISADGRGHFLSSYDGNEEEQGEFFIYRVN